MKADKILSEHGINYKLVEQDNPTKDCDDAARERGIETSQIVKSLIVRRDGELYHVCIPGDRELSEKKFGEQRLVEPEKSKEITGFESGTVHPLSSGLKHFIDERVFEQGRVSFTVGSDTEGVILDSDSFLEALKNEDFSFEVNDIVVTEEEDIEELKQKGVGEEIAGFLADKGYRSILLDLHGEFPVSDIVKSVKKLHREEIIFDVEEVRELVRKAENENHMHKLAEKLAEDGEFPDEEDSFDLEIMIEEIIERNSNAISDYKEGKDSALNYLIGQVMQQTNGRANAEKARELIREEVE